MPTYERKTVDILISDDLRNILREIESESIVASLLLRKRHTKEDLVDSPVNYISISSQDRSKLSYLTTDRMETLDTDTYWTSSRRYHVKPGAFIGKLFCGIPSKEVEKFSNLFRSQSVKTKFTFDIISGNEIKKYYYHESYASNERGSLGVSCMKHEHCQNLFSLYTKNENKVNMLIMLNSDGYLIGRALLWNFDGNKIMDRIYTMNDEDLSFHFKKWATENNYLYKSEQNWFNTLYFENLSNKRKELKLEIKLDNYRPMKYPYMDTFKFINLDNGVISNFIPDEDNSVRTLTSSDGGYHDSDHLKFDGIDKVFRYRNEAVYVSYLDIYTSRNNVEYSNVNDQYILREHMVLDEVIGDVVFNTANEFRNRDRVAELRESRNKRNEEREQSSSSSRSSIANLSEELPPRYRRLGDVVDPQHINYYAHNWGRPTEQIEMESPIVDHAERIQYEETMESLDWERYQNDMDMAAEEYAFSNSESNEVQPEEIVTTPSNITFDIEQLQNLTNMLSSPTGMASSFYLDWLATTRLDTGMAGDILRQIENVNPS